MAQVRLQVLSDTYPCKYAPFKRDHKTVAVSVMKLYMLHFNSSNRVKTKKRSGVIGEAARLVEFRARPLLRDQPIAGPGTH